MIHTKPDLSVFLKWMIAGSGSVITDVIRLHELMRLILLTVLFSICFTGCDRSVPASGSTGTTADFVASSGSLLKRFGKLTSADGTLVVEARQSSVSIVNYSVFDAETNSVLATGGGFSDAQRWYLYFDSKNQLWVYNSDIGGFGYWKRTETAMEYVDVDRDTPKTEIPIPVIDNLPNSIKRYFGWG